MNLEQILKLAGELITDEQLEAINENECVVAMQDNGLSGSDMYYGKHWYTIYFKETFIDKNCDDVKEIQVYTE